MKKDRKKRWAVFLAAYVTVCLIIDFYPIYGRPHFRYTGSDPSKAVWNIGWPLATMIFDDSSDIHVGPFAYVLFPMELIILALTFAIITLLRLLPTQCPGQSAKIAGGDGEDII
jgi:hypothetical protein